MQVSLVITILGPDQPGLIKSLSEILQQFQGNWMESRMSHLAGRFAGLVHVLVPKEHVEKLSEAVLKLQTDSFKILIDKTSLAQVKEPSHTLTLEILGQDRPGIIHDITQQLATLNVNIEELESKTEEASMSGGTLFRASLDLGLPKDITPEEVQESLESMSDQFMVDLIFSS